MADYDPYQHAAELGIRVDHQSLRSANGLWVPDHNLILIRSGMRKVHDRSTLAHELAHALLGHRDDRPKHEVQADRLAADNLIDFDECRRAFRTEQDFYRAALELQVSTRLLRVYLNVHRLAS